MGKFKKAKIKKFLFYWPIILIVLLVFAFFWKFFVKGLIPIPADITVGMYFPWLDYKWGYVVGVPVKNSLITLFILVLLIVSDFKLPLFKRKVV